MSDKPLAPMDTWLVEPMDAPVAAAIERLRRAPDVRKVAIMPDVHLAKDVCVGTAFATSQLIYPAAVGGDIGCGILALAFDATAEDVGRPEIAGTLLREIGSAIPALRRHRNAVMPMPHEVQQLSLSHHSLESLRREEGATQLGTLGSGNHFIELQADENERLWLMIHSGSRAMGQAIRAHHEAGAQLVGAGLKALDAKTESGQAYLNDMTWARRYADANRRAMAKCVADVLNDAINARACWETLIAIDHNHVVNEEYDGNSFWVHRKGAMPAGTGIVGALPGSMGTASFHVEGRGVPAALRSSAHGAGRALSRERARNSISQRQVQQQMQNVWFDYRMASDLREEAPSAYKDVRAVLRAQRELVKTIRFLRPLLNYKGR